ncbi:unnamed protein product [Pieris brassicae]|uniref:Uncharacterized protein n=1 Tax=Pieris brassicae TaxID=7116 RepID=A0A9P0TD93_PIEBR|nr:unnamed protein product [Pieris brassicae]
MTSDDEVSDNVHSDSEAIPTIANEPSKNAAHAINLNKHKVLKRKVDRLEQAAPLIDEHNLKPPRGCDELDRFPKWTYNILPHLPLFPTSCPYSLRGGSSSETPMSKSGQLE